ncbi:uncharacterized protein LOC110689240 [Chenopodium quinoa]|uniref:Uncharacterized protein n=1 Tax=Chenopodium quinoa TaxID=63459 RepID=A0A803LM58_CHEQI|nr:uncharacterized protein LOC110689240 [Chenopodium quinoa]
MESPQLVQHVSDQLLRKFAEIDSDSDYDHPSSPPRKRRTTQKKRKVVYGDENDWETCILMSPLNVGSNASLRVVERKSLLPQHYKTRRSSSSSSSGNFIVKHLRAHRFRGARDFRTKCVLSAIEKTWSKAVRGASKVFMEKHYNRHRSLIDDIV